MIKATFKYSPSNRVVATETIIWYHLYNLKNVKNTHGGVLLWPTTLLKVTLLLGYFSRFLKCTNDTKTRNASHLEITGPNTVFIIIYEHDTWFYRNMFW